MDCQSMCISFLSKAEGTDISHCLNLQSPWILGRAEPRGWNLTRLPPLDEGRIHNGETAPWSRREPSPENQTDTSKEDGGKGFGGLLHRTRTETVGSQITSWLGMHNHETL